MVQETVTRWLPAAGILTAALLTFSCQKSGRPAAPPPPAPLSFPSVPSTGSSAPTASATAAPAPVTGPGNPAPGPPPTGQKPAAGGIVLQPQPAAPAPKGLASAGSLVAMGRDGRVLPEDFKIGPLGDAQAQDKGQDQAMETAGRFLTALVGGKVDKDLIAEDARDAMAGTLSYGLSNGEPPTAWRLGRPRTRTDGEVTAAVRLFSKDGSSEGEIYVAKTGSAWLVSDLQVSLAQLSVKSEKPKEKFLPLDYRWLLEESAPGEGCMGTEVGRIEKEFVFKSLADGKVPCDVHGSRREYACRFSGIREERLEMEPLEGTLEGITAGEEVRVFFYLKNNYHTFVARVIEATPSLLAVQQPPGVYKNLQRKFERVKLQGAIDVSFSLKGTKVELNFPKSDRYNPVEPPEENAAFDTRKIHDVVQAFRIKMQTITTDNKIIMLRDRMPRQWEEKTIVRMGKSLWIPSTAEDFPSRDPFPDERVITKSELIALEEEAGSAPYVITSKLGNILYEKTKKDIVSELWCPVLYNEYVVGYIHAWNTGAKRERISRDTIEYIQQFAKVLCYALVTNGYFKVENSTERRYEAPIIDLSASGLLFAHTAADLVKELLVHSDLELTLQMDATASGIPARTIRVGGRIMRKFRDAENGYFGVLFMRIEQEDFEYLFRYLYGKEFDPSLEGKWEGGAPPPPLDMS